MMRTRSLIVFVMMLLLVALAVNFAAAAADPQTGTWKMNAAKSKYSPGPAPKSLTVKVEADANHVKINADGINGDGSALHVAYDAKFDGKDYPATGISSADTVSVTRLKDGSIQSQQKKGGQVVMTITSVVSKDGKTRTSTWKGKDAQGHDVNNVVVLDKQ
jgi:ABC-type glycerol-3-phosphate transport system substrate-binding protein